MSELDHIGIAVHSIEESLPLWRDQLGLKFEGIEEVPTEGVRVAMLMAGSTRIELLEPLGPETPIGRHLDRRGAGIHHVALKVNDLAGMMSSLKEAGRPPLDEAPQPGAGGAEVTFLHPRTAGGVLVELTTGHGGHGDEVDGQAG